MGGGLGISELPMIRCPKCQGYLSIYADHCNNKEPTPCAATKEDIEAAVAGLRSTGRLLAPAAEPKLDRLRRMMQAVVQALDDDREA